MIILNEDISEIIPYNEKVDMRYFRSLREMSGRDAAFFAYQKCKTLGLSVNVSEHNYFESLYADFIRRYGYSVFTKSENKDIAILALVGKGAFGDVYLIQNKDGQQMVMKVEKINGALYDSNQQFIDKVTNEANVQNTMHKPIVFTYRENVEPSPFTLLIYYTMTYEYREALYSCMFMEAFKSWEFTLRDILRIEIPDSVWQMINTSVNDLLSQMWASKCTHGDFRLNNIHFVIYSDQLVDVDDWTIENTRIQLFDFGWSMIDNELGSNLFLDIVTMILDLYSTENLLPQNTQNLINVMFGIIQKYLMLENNVDEADDDDEDDVFLFSPLLSEVMLRYFPNKQIYYFDDVLFINQLQNDLFEVYRDHYYRNIIEK